MVSIFVAIGERNDELVNSLLLSNPQAVNARGADGATPLIAAALFSNHSAARRLLSAGANPNIADDYGRTALHHAAARDDRQMLNLLLTAGANVNVEDDNGSTPLSYAVSSGSDACRKLLETNEATIASHWTSIELAEVASWQRGIILLLSVDILCDLLLLGRWADYKWLRMGLGIFGIYCVYKLAATVRLARPLTYAFVQIIPLVGLFYMLTLNGAATRVLRQHGIRVGFFGANATDILEKRTLESHNRDEI